MDYELKEFDLNSVTEIEGDENYSRYVEDLERMKDLEGVYIAYQHGKIVYVGSKKIENGLEIAVNKLKGIVCNAPILILKIGDSNVRYLINKMKDKTKV